MFIYLSQYSKPFNLKRIKTTTATMNFSTAVTMLALVTSTSAFVHGPSFAKVGSTCISIFSKL